MASALIRGIRGIGGIPVGVRMGAIRTAVRMMATPPKADLVSKIMKEVEPMANKMNKDDSTQAQRAGLEVARGVVERYVGEGKILREEIVNKAVVAAATEAFYVDEALEERQKARGNYG